MSKNKLAVIYRLPKHADFGDLSDLPRVVVARDLTQDGGDTGQARGPSGEGGQPNQPPPNQPPPAEPPPNQPPPAEPPPDQQPPVEPPVEPVGPPAPDGPHPCGPHPCVSDASVLHGAATDTKPTTFCLRVITHDIVSVPQPAIAPDVPHLLKPTMVCQICQTQATQLSPNRTAGGQGSPG
jgi:hypothetical protein